MGEVIDRDLARTRKKFARRQWRRRWLRWKIVLSALAFLGLVVGGIYVVFFSSWLSVQGAVVRGNDTLSVAQVLDVASVPSGDPLATADLAAIGTRVESLATVREVDVSRQWPDRILIRVSERTPVAVVEIGDTLRAMDASGILFREFKQVPPDLPTVRASSAIGTEALVESARVVAALPADLALQVDHVEVRTIDQVRLVLRDERIVVWGSSEESEQKAEVLTALLNRDAKVYDVSVPGRPTTRSS